MGELSDLELAEQDRRYNAGQRLRMNGMTARANAVRDGVLTKPTACQRCGAKGARLMAHVLDLARPLDCEWWCPKCQISWRRANPDTKHRPWAKPSTRKCPDCGLSYLPAEFKLATRAGTRIFCSACARKRVLEHAGRLGLAIRFYEGE